MKMSTKLEKKKSEEKKSKIYIIWLVYSPVFNFNDVDATYKVSRQLAQWLFLCFEHGGHLGYVTWIIFFKKFVPFPKEAPRKIWL